MLANSRAAREIPGEEKESTKIARGEVLLVLQLKK